MDERVRKYLQDIGRKGGSVKSEAKSLAARANARKPRGRRNNNTQEESSHGSDNETQGREPEVRG